MHGNLYRINGDKKSIMLKLNQSALDHLNVSVDKENILLYETGYDGYKWSIWLYNRKRSDGKYLTYGTCGDSTFGLKLSWYKQKYFGNVRAARHCYREFIKKTGLIISGEIDKEVEKFKMKFELLTS